MEFYISPLSGQFYMINVLENQWLSVTCSGAKILKGYNQYFENIKVNYYFRIDSKIIRYLPWLYLLVSINLMF